MIIYIILIIFIIFIFFQTRLTYDFQFNAHALGAYNSKIYTNCKEAFINSYRNGFRVFEVDVAITKTDDFVITHATNTVETFSTKQFLKHNQMGTPLLLSDILDIMTKYPDITVMFDFLPGFYDRNDSKYIKKFVRNFTNNEIASRSIIEVYSAIQAEILKKENFSNIQMWIDYPTERKHNFKTIYDYLEFFQRKNINIASIGLANLKNYPEEALALKNSDINLFVSSVNSYSSLKKLKKIMRKVVVTTDFLIPNPSISLRAKIVLYYILYHISLGEYKEFFKKKLVQLHWKQYSYMANFTQSSCENS